MSEQQPTEERPRQRPQGLHQYPPQQGLYDPAYERDACGMAFIAHIKGHRSHAIVAQALEALVNLNHRGAAGSEANTGDGAGIMIQLPLAFLAREAETLGIQLPPAGYYGVGMLFLPHDPQRRHDCESALARIIQEEGQALLGWRTVPTNNSALGNTALRGEPHIRQLFIGRGATVQDALAFERKLYVIRRRAEQEIDRHAPLGVDFYIPSLSSRTIVYKGMLLAEQIADYYPDLADPLLDTALALIHSRFSTNTFPSWARAHPYRYVIHNGEINTLRGNVNWMRAREHSFVSDAFGDDLPKLLPVVDPGGSDTAMFDNCLELLTLAGRSLPHAVMMMIPEPWQRHTQMDPIKRDFYEYHSCLMEAWDGPAAIGFTDGTRVGAVLDRNGLRPSRYYVTKDDLVIMASEVGVIDIPPENVAYKGRLQPGRMFLVDTGEGRIISDEELKSTLAAERPYGAWLRKNMVRLSELPSPPSAARPDGLTVIQRQQAFGYTFEDLRLLIAPMAKDGVEALGSMGDDTPPAVLSQRPQPLFNYFKQLFAQVTNPPIDAIREELITATDTLLGGSGNILHPQPEAARRVRLPHPILANEDLARIRAIALPGFKAATLPILFAADGGAAALEAGMDGLYAAADAAIAGGVNLLILSDRGINRRRAAIPCLLATSGLHHHLIRTGRRTEVSILVESGEPREVHHFATLLGFGADAINPYLVFETVAELIAKELLEEAELDVAIGKYIKATVKGVVKILSKMGISTVQSYRGAQIFEALGLEQALVARYFTGTPSRISGSGIDVITEEVLSRHRYAFPARPVNGHTLSAGGRYQFREDGEQHLFNPATIHALQHAVRSGDYEAFKRYTAGVNDRSKHLCTLRGLLDLVPAAAPLPLEEVEPVATIMRRFKTGAMSYGSISAEAHEALAIAMNRIGGRSNTGEGGEDPQRYTADANGDSRASAIKQVASGRFGVTSEYLVNAQEIQIKMAQGAKPGEGGQLPGHKVYPWIAKVRFSTPGVGLISPPPHHDIYSIEDLAQLIFDLKNANPRARINVKLVSEVGVGTIAAGVAKGHADVILISGSDGGTGASPQTSIKHAGLPWELGLAETHQTLLLNDLRSRVRLETDGQLKTGRDIVVAALLGAEEFGFATSPLVALGCIMMRVCHLNTCPVGIATQDPALRQRFSGDPQHIVNFMQFIAAEVRELMAALGFRTMDEMIGRTDRLRTHKAVDHWKARGLDLSPILHRPATDAAVGAYFQQPQDHGLEQTMDRQTLLDLCAPALARGEQVRASLPIRNTNRTVGTILGSEITRRCGAQGLPDDTIVLTFSGSAGQSFGAFTPRGLTLRLEGDANDYVGKGLSGARLVVHPPAGSTFEAAENIIIGNVALYGATSGEAFISGMAGERFAVRNSGAAAVVEGVGDHGCEYMTGGRVVVLGRTGRNFAAGMSGGVAYVLNETGDFATRCNQDMVTLTRLIEPQEIQQLRDLIWRHAGLTGSRRAWSILSNWQTLVPRFVKVLPKDYQRMMDAIAAAEASGLRGDEALLAAFEANKQAPAKVKPG